MDRPSRTRAFDVAYEGTPSWETGRPQPAVLRLLDEGAFGRRVLDAGCGTGRHAVMLAGLGRTVIGVDVAARAIGLARERARADGVPATFVVGDVLDPAGLATTPGGPFDTVLDVGLFHVLQPVDRQAYATALAAVTVPGGEALVIAWSDRNPFGRGPARIRRREIRDAFRSSTGWAVTSIEAGVLETRLDPGQVLAWVARVRRR